jgi:hypothetical protein
LRRITVVKARHQHEVVLAKSIQAATGDEQLEDAGCLGCSRVAPTLGPRLRAARRWIREFAIAASMPDMLEEFDRVLNQSRGKN